MHNWNDKTFDWNGLDSAGRIIQKTLKLARVGCNWKEKYGSLRTSVSFFDGSLHSVVYPGYHYSQFPKWLWHLDLYYIQPFFVKTKIYKVINALQIPFYTLGFFIAMKKYPHIREEICVDADHPEYILGGKEIHDKYWTTIK